MSLLLTAVYYGTIGKSTTFRPAGREGLSVRWFLLTLCPCGGKIGFVILPTNALGCRPRMEATG
jgi:hypothetical protein